MSGKTESSTGLIIQVFLENTIKEIPHNYLTRVFKFTNFMAAHFCYRKNS